MGDRWNQHRTAFLRMAAAQLRELARLEPRVEAELCQIADKLEIEAAEMEADD